MNTRNKDVQIHAAVTVMPNSNNVLIMDRDPANMQPIEIAQFAVQLDAKFGPFTAKQLKIAFDGLYYNCLEKMRSAGLLRAGS